MWLGFDGLGLWLFVVEFGWICLGLLWVVFLVVEDVVVVWWWLLVVGSNVMSVDCV